MNLPFTIDQFMDVFRDYNQTVWPFQAALYLLAAAIIFLTFRKTDLSDKLISGGLAFFWIWIGFVYHIMFFSGINKPAYIFGALFILQGIIFLYAGVYKHNLAYEFSTKAYGITGSVFIIYALIIYPLLSHNFGHVYPAQPTFGLPCPTTIFTFGVLLMTAKRIPGYVLIIPFLWSLVGFSAAVNLNVREDFGLVIAGIVGTTLIIVRDRKSRPVKVGPSAA